MLNIIDNVYSNMLIIEFHLLSQLIRESKIIALCQI